MAMNIAQAKSNTEAGNLAFLPPPPPLESHMGQNDQNIFKETRKLKETSRWALAAHDADRAVPVQLEDFSCAAGFKLDAARAPHLVSLLEEMKKFEEPIVSVEKKYWQRDRPFVVFPDEPLCKARPLGKKPSFAYPSGHTTDGWSVALMLAQFLPDRARDIMERGRIYGESRVVCGVHWASDVWAGYMNGSALFSEFMSKPGTAAMVEAARSELAALKAHPTSPNAEMCKIEHDAARFSPLTQTH